MINPKVERKVLIAIYKRYIEDHGPGIVDLYTFADFVTNTEDYVNIVPGMVHVESGRTTHPLRKYIDELEMKGYVAYVPPSRLKFRLTEKGYYKASKKWWMHFLDFLNTNSGVSVVVSSLSLIIAFVALLVSIFRG